MTQKVKNTYRTEHSSLQQNKLICIFMAVNINMISPFSKTLHGTQFQAPNIHIEATRMGLCQLGMQSRRHCSDWWLVG